VGLTSAGFVITTAVLAVVAVVAVPLLWDRAAWTRTVRSASVLVAVLLVVLAVGGFVNAQAGFFPTWGSLFGDSSAGLAVGHGGVDADLSGVSGRGATDRAPAGVPGRPAAGTGRSCGCSSVASAAASTGSARCTCRRRTSPGTGGRSGSR